MRDNEPDGLGFLVFTFVFVFATLSLVYEVLWVPSASWLKERTAEQSQSQEVTISYNIFLDSIYTGTPTYAPYRIEETIKVRKILLLGGNPDWIKRSGGGVVDFKRVNGEQCRLTLGIAGKEELLPCAKRGTMEGTIKLNNRFIIVSARIEKLNEDRFILHISPSDIAAGLGWI